MVERHGRPCLLIALDGDSGRGSGRSIPAYDLHAGLSACAHHLGRFGGHPAAAGLEIEAASFDAFRAAFLDHARGVLSPDDLVPVERVDAVVPATALGLPLAEELELLAPFGQGNPRPTLLVPAAQVGDVRALGADGEHAALTLSSGGARARVVAFGTTPKSLRGRADRRLDVAARLELNEWNGAVEPRLVLRALNETEMGECAVLGAEMPLWEALERELSTRLAPAPDEGAGVRTVSDHRGDGFAGTVGDLLSSGEDVLVVCADIARRRRAVEGLVGALGRTLRGGGGRSTQLSLVSWAALERDPRLARPYPHLVALDPPENARGERLLGAAPGPPGMKITPRAHVCWGRSEVDFARRSARARLELRPALTELYRALRAGGGELSGGALARALWGSGQYPRDPELCARLISVLGEPELPTYTGRAGSEPVCWLRARARRVELECSPTYRASLARLAEAHAYLRDGALRARLDRSVASSWAAAQPGATDDRLAAAEVAA
jgi:single-stranded-DNA-specific exonuclease